jgi:hypothetical protein
VSSQSHLSLSHDPATDLFVALLWPSAPCPAFHFFAEAPFPPWPPSQTVALGSIDKHRDWLDICVTTKMPARPLWSEGPDQAARMPDRLDAFLAWVQPLESTCSPDIAIKVQPGSHSRLFSATRDSSAAP